MSSTIILYIFGFIIILVGLFWDPIGSSPDTGIIELGEKTLKTLICLLGLLFIFVGYKSDEKKS